MSNVLKTIRTAAPARRDPQELNFPAMLERSKAEIARALPKHIDPDRMLRIALTAFRTTPALAKCKPVSVLASIIQASQLGLEVGQNGEAHLVPFKEECQMIPGYQGLMKLARNSGFVKDIYAHEVRENDHFEMRLGLERHLDHHPMPGRGGFPASEAMRGEVVGFYAVGVLKDGTPTFVALSVEDVHQVRDNSKGYQAAKRYGKASTWDTDFIPMGKKTVIRALCKMMPKSAELSAAIALNDVADRGHSQNISLKEAADGSYEAPTVVDEETGEIIGNQAEQSAPGAFAQPQQAQQPKEPQPPVQAQKNAPKPREDVLSKVLASMTAASTEDDLNEAYIRAETQVSGVDREILDKAYEKRLEEIRKGDGQVGTLL